MRTKFKAWTVPYMEQHKDVCIKLDEFNNIHLPSKIFLEIGCGKGDFICKMALNNLDALFIGVEKNITCAGISTKKIVDQEIKNALMICDDVEKLFPTLKDELFDGVLLNFSDPWPKKRHSKRRLTDERFIDNYYRIIKKGGILNFKTDNSELFAFSVKMFEKSQFNILSIDDNYDGKDEFDALTEYEANFRSKGVNIHRICLKKE